VSPKALLAGVRALQRILSEHMFVPVERRYELESLRRSIAMLRVGAPALDREAATVLVRELQALEREIRRLRNGMQQLLEDPPP
jgi:hypothetical protein